MHNYEYKGMKIKKDLDYVSNIVLRQRLVMNLIY